MRYVIKYPPTIFIIEAHTAIILNEYAKLHKDEHIYATLTPAEDIYPISVGLKLLWSWIVNHTIWWIKSWFSN